MVRQEPQDVFEGAVVDGFVGEDLIDGLAPQVTVGRAAVLVELEDDLAEVDRRVGAEGVSAVVARGEFRQDPVGREAVAVVDEVFRIRRRACGRPGG